MMSCFLSLAKIVVPMAMPLLVCPGVIDHVIQSSLKAAKCAKTLLPIVVTLNVSMLALIIPAKGETLQQMIVRMGLNIMQRAKALFLDENGVQSMVTGALDIFRSMSCRSCKRSRKRSRLLSAPVGLGLRSPLA